MGQEQKKVSLGPTNFAAQPTSGTAALGSHLLDMLVKFLVGDGSQKASEDRQQQITFQSNLDNARQANNEQYYPVRQLWQGKGPGPLRPTYGQDLGTLLSMIMAQRQAENEAVKRASNPWAGAAPTVASPWAPNK